MQNNPTELRVALFTPENDVFISPSFDRTELFRGSMPPKGVAVEVAARGIVDNPQFKVRATSALHDLGTTEGIRGYSLRTSLGAWANLSSAALRLIKLEHLATAVEKDPGSIEDPIDLEFIKRCLEISIISTRLKRQKR